MNLELGFAADQRAFIDQALEKCAVSGKGASLLLVGSRAAKLNDAWSDLDLWILGNKNDLAIDERNRYEIDKQLFFDRGDHEAHWSFYDYGDIETAVENWNDEFMWILGTSQIIHGESSRVLSIKDRCKLYPYEVAEKKLKRQFGKYCSLLGPLNMAARDKPISAFVVAGLIIECLCKLCCLAESKPFPYTKWLTEVAKETRMGLHVFPHIQRAILGIDEFNHPPAGRHYRQLVPLKELRETCEIVQCELKELGWRCSWIDDKDEAVAGICGCGTAE